MTDAVRAFAPGRVNLIGDHTDHSGGLALPCAIELGITITGERADTIELTTSIDGTEVSIALPVTDERRDDEPGWARYVRAVAGLVPHPLGVRGRVVSDLPVGAGLSSSAALEIVTALALGLDAAPMDVALLAREAEHRATGTPTGLLDQLAITHAVAGHALCIDFATLDVEPVAMPTDVDIVIVHSGEERTVESSAYAERVGACTAATGLLGPLPIASLDAIGALDDPVLRRRARHVRSECDRVRAAVDALRTDDVVSFGALMIDSHRSLRDDFEVSTARLDELVDRLCAVPGVHGARLTGAGFGGCVVALSESGAIDDPSSFTGRGWIVQPSAGARRD